MRRFFRGLSSVSHRISIFHGIFGDRPRRIKMSIWDRSAYHLCFQVVIRSRVFINKKLLGAKFVVRIQLLLILLPKIQKPLKILRRQQLLNNINRKHLLTIVLRTLDKIRISSQTFLEISLHTIHTKRMRTFILHMSVYR